MKKNYHWFTAFPGAITVTDEKGTIIEMNEQSAEMFTDDGGYDIIGRNVLDCHPEPAQKKVREIYESQQSNIYSIQKNGKKKLIYQTPYFIEGKFSGFVEICLPLPKEMPHFNRDIPST